MSTLSINRTLWYEANGNRLTLSQTELHHQATSLVILGEAGMGKTHLLEWIANAPGHAFCTARKLINRSDPRTLLGDAQILVIDALDEVSVQRDGEAVDAVLRRLGELGYPRFVLSCRVADWRSATGMETIREQYESGDAPLELHLEPFSDEDAVAFLDHETGTGEATSIVDHFRSRGLSGFLGNPQTLQLIADIAGSGPLPNNRADLFERAVRVLSVETHDAKAGTQVALDAVLDAAGAAFAALILTGSEAIVRVAQSNVAEGDISLSEVRRFPGAEDLDDAIGTRLFRAIGTERFGYWHRRIGEYLGARWLVKQANSGRMRRRILSLLQSHGLVPASLRGMHAWLAQAPQFAEQVISGDPMGVVEYGDADNLSSERARHLLQALQAIAKRNPNFRGYGEYSVHSIVQPALIEDVRVLLTDPGTAFGVLMLLLEALRAAPIAARMETELRMLLLDQSMAFAVRRRAVDALALSGRAQAWPTLVSSLIAQGDDLALRLGIETIDMVGYTHFSDDLIVDLVVAFAQSDSHTLGVLNRPEKNLPDERLEGILDGCVKAATTAGRISQQRGEQELTDFVYHLVTRRLAAGPIAPAKIWYWLQPFDSDRHAHRESRKKLAQRLARDSTLRLGVLRHVVLADAEVSALAARYWQLTSISPGFAMTGGDIITFLDELDPENREDERWRDLIQLTNHDHEHGADVRAAAKRFASGRPDIAAWIDSLAEPRIYEWQIKQQKRQEEHLAQQSKQHAVDRQDFTGRVDAIRRGDSAAVADLAMAYLGLYRNIGAEDSAAHERISQWLGNEINEAAQVGFEAFLALDPPDPTADEIAESFAQGSEWYAGYIIVAALAERRRVGAGLDDLSDERLLAGFFVLHKTKIDDHAGIGGLEEVLEKAIRGRGLWTDAMRRYLEPQLAARQTYVDGLAPLMHEETDEAIATDLAAEWLVRFQGLPADPEAELVDRLIRSSRFDELKSLYGSRVSQTADGQRLNWVAVGLLVDFVTMAPQLASGPVQPELLWHIHDRAGGGYRRHMIRLPFELLEWVAATYRTLWPLTGYPKHVRVGDRNSWDASEFLESVIRRLGTEPSDAAAAALRRLAEAQPDGYTPMIHAIAAEQARLRVETIYVPPTLEAIKAVTRDTVPSSARDLQAFMLEELAVVQEKIKSDDVESWRGFFDDTGAPYDEERCRDHLLGLLRQGVVDVALDPETHVAADKEVDITCTAGQFRLPIEVKGQWHPQLWHAADTQLDKLYASDWRANGCGIYLILWFGDNVQDNKRLASPGRGVPKPTSPEQLRMMLADRSLAARDGRIAIVVLDLERS